MVHNLEGMIATANNVLSVTVKDIAGSFQNKSIAEASAALNKLANDVGATVININATIAKSILARALRMDGWSTTPSTVKPYTDSLTKIVK